MALDQGFGGLGGLGSLFGGSGGGGSGGMNDLMMGAALLDAGRPQTAEQRKPLMQTIAPIMQMQQQQQEKAALSAALQQLGLPKAQADVMAASDKSAAIALQVQQLKQQKEMVNKAQSGFDRIFGGGNTGASTGPPAGQTQSAVEPPAQLAQLFSAKEQEHGLPAGYLGRTAQIESNFDPAAVSPTGARGPFQFTSGTANQYNLTNPHDWNASTDAAARLAKDNAASLKARLGRDPTPAELYLAHQQGADGAANLLLFPDVPASTVVPAKNIAVNGGRPDMKAGDFANLWLNKYGQPSSGGREGPQMAASADLPAQGAQTADVPGAGSSNAAFYIPGTDPAQRVDGAGAPVQVAQASAPGTATDAPSPGGNAASLPSPPLVQAKAQAQIAQDSQRAQQGQMGRMEALQKAAAFAKLGLAYEGAGVKGGADNLKPFTEFYLGLAKPTEKERDLIGAGFVPGTPQYSEAYKRGLTDNRPEAVKLAGAQTDPNTPADQREIVRSATPNNDPQAVRLATAELKAKGVVQGTPEFNAQLPDLLEKYSKYEGGAAESAKEAKVGGAVGDVIADQIKQYADPKQYEAARTMRNQATLMERAANDDSLYLGKGGATALNAKKWIQAGARTLGVETPSLDQAIASGEGFNKFARLQATAMGRQAEGGAIRANQSLQMFLESNASLDTSKQGNLRMIGVIKQDADRTMALQSAMKKYITKAGTELDPAEMDKIVDKYDAEHPLYDPIDPQKRPLWQTADMTPSQDALQKQQQTAQELGAANGGSATKRGASQIQDGATATNPQTGAKIQFRNGRWEQIGGQL